MRGSGETWQMELRQAVQLNVPENATGLRQGINNVLCNAPGRNSERQTEHSYRI